MLSPDHRRYLLSRTYTDEMIDREEIDSRGEVITWTCRSMSGALIGHQIRDQTNNGYRWEQAQQAHHLPIMYGTDEDHDRFHQTGRIVLVEGIFDRAATKRCLPDTAVYARLSRGVAKHLLCLLKRYATTVLLLFDQDEHGEKATRDAEEKLQPSVETHRLMIPTKDPAKLLEKLGEARARAIIQTQARLWDI